MPKDETPQKNAQLSLELLRRIPKHRKISSRELQEQLAGIGMARTLRSIQRCLAQLGTQYDIECDPQSKPYGYRWKEQASGFSLAMLSPQESLLLMLAKQQLSSLLPQSLMRSMASFFEQAERSLAPYEEQTKEREWLSKVRVVATSQPLLPPKIKPGIFEAVSLALYENYWLTGDYKNAEGTKSRIEVMPLGLAQQGPRLYLICRYQGYDNERALALHRFISAESSGRRFPRPADFDLQKYDEDARFGFGHGKKIRLSFCLEKGFAQHLLESPLSQDQKAVAHDKHYAFTATVIDSDMLDWWLRGFGEALFELKKEAL